MYRYLIAIGSNLGDRKASISKSKCMLEDRLGSVTAFSSLVDSVPIGAATEQFLNGALVCESLLPPVNAMQQILEIENAMGRTRTVRWGNRNIDLDIILVEDALGTPLVIDEPNIIVPHPEMHRRDFVLAPALEIAATWVHPLLKKSIAQLYAELQPASP
jgi:2-amino-4-hydroxy-6-hydroxymethyldihydropteridine diphosphokinase